MEKFRLKQNICKMFAMFRSTVYCDVYLTHSSCRIKSKLHPVDISGVRQLVFNTHSAPCRKVGTREVDKAPLPCCLYRYVANIDRP